MYRVKRTVYVDNQAIDVWFGLVSKTKNGKMVSIRSTY